MAIHCSILAWEIPWTEEPRGLQSMGAQELDMTEQLSRAEHVETNTLSYVKQITSGNLTYDAGNSNLVLCDNLRGMGYGTEVQERGDICMPIADSS